MLRIGTRESALALWQAKHVQQLLLVHGIESTLVPITSEGDIDLTTPLYEMGVQGIFTRSLDVALLNDKIDVAVHSYKDVPTQLPTGLALAAVLDRGSTEDVLVLHPNYSNWSMEQIAAEKCIIATSSIRRKAQWLGKFPHHEIKNLRGNVNTRLQKIKDEHWHGAIFAKAGLERIHLLPTNAIILDWMLPAPAQGAIAIVTRTNENEILEQCKLINHQPTYMCTYAERMFLRSLMGGCSTPISALAQIEKETIQFEGNVLSKDGSKQLSVKMSKPVDDYKNLGTHAAQYLIEKGAKQILKQ